MEASKSEFLAKPAQRRNIPLLIGVCGPSGCGKTWSALRLATGIRSVVGGPIHVIDTENRRAEHYSDFFKFEHVDFRPPFSSLRYLEAIQAQVDQGAKTVIVDSMSHEHSGEGGMLDAQEAEFQRLGSRDAVKMLSWVKPKHDRRALIDGILRTDCNIIFCFRAKSVVKPIKNAATGKTEMVPQGWEPISGNELVFELMCNAVLLPKSNGVPTWNSEKAGEAMTMKLPHQFREIFDKQQPLSEDIGRQLAEWARGGTAGQKTDHLKTGRAAAEQGSEALKAWWRAISPDDQKALKKSLDGELKKIAAAADAKSKPEPGNGVDDHGNPLPAPQSGQLFADSATNPDKL